MKLIHAYTLCFSCGVALTAFTSLAAGTEKYPTVDALPSTGHVIIDGVVAKIDDPDSFTLKDSAGEMIDVDTSSEMSLSVGDKVSVTGEVKEKMMGMGHKIADASVMTGSDAKTSTDGAKDSDMPQKEKTPDKQGY